MKARKGTRQGAVTGPTRRKRGSPASSPALKPDIFLRLSRVLTAHQLDAGLAEVYFVELRRLVGPNVEALLDRFEGILRAGGDPVRAIRDEILPDRDLGPIAKSILLLWYTGGIQKPGGSDWEMQSPDQYYSGLVWEAIGAHPPTLSNGYFGHWKYPPEM